MTTTPDLPPLTVSARAVARMTSLAETTIRNMCVEGVWPGAYKRGRRWLIPYAEITAWVERSSAIAAEDRAMAREDALRRTAPWLRKSA